MPEAPQNNIQTGGNADVNRDQLSLFGESVTTEPTSTVGHSGKLGLEKPVNEFEAPLDKPSEAGILSTPDSPATLPENMPPLGPTVVPPPEHQFPPQQLETGKKKLTPKAKAAVAITGLLVAGGAYLGLSGKSSNNKGLYSGVVATSPQPTPQETTPPTTEAFKSSMVPEYAEVTSSTPTDEDIKIIYKDIQEYLRTGDQTFLDAAYGDNSEDTTLGASTAAVLQDRQNYFDNHYGTKERYKRTVEDITPNSDGSFTITFTDQLANVIYEFKDVITFKTGFSTKHSGESWFVDALASEEQIGTPTVQY